MLIYSTEYGRWKEKRGKREKEKRVRLRRTSNKYNSLYVLLTSMHQTINNPGPGEGYSQQQP